MELTKDFDLACQLQAKTFKAASKFGSECNRAIYQAAEIASTETLDNFQGQVVPAGTGTGKTTFTLALIAARVQTDPNYTAAFVTPTIDAAQAAYDALIKMLPKEQVAVHSSAHAAASEAAKRDRAVQQHFINNGPSSRGSMANARVAVCTHEAWLSEGLSEASHGVRYHLTGLRKNVFVDEFPDAVRVQDISASDLVELANEFERHPDTRRLAEAITEIATTGSAKDDGTTERFWLVQQLADLDVIEFHDIDLSRLATASSPERCKTAITALRRAIAGNAFWVRTGPQQEGGTLGHKRLITFSNSFRKHPGLVILDATARYALAAETLNSVVVPQVRYPRMNICHVDGPSELQGRCLSRLKITELPLYVKWIAGLVRQHLSTSETSLVVVHKSVRKHLSAQLHAEIEETGQVLLTHWGCDVGSNKYRNCKTVFLFSEFYQPRHVYLAKALGSTEQVATSFTLRQATGQYCTGTVSHAEEAHLLRQFKQMACRGTARHVDDHGSAAPMRIITSMDRVRLLKCLPELFPGAPPIVTIASPNSKRSTKGHKLANHLLQAMQLKKSLQLDAEDVLKATGIMPKDLKRAFSSRECRNLENFGWKFIPGAGRRSKPYLLYDLCVKEREETACAA